MYLSVLRHKSFVSKDFTLWLKVSSENITAPQLRKRVVSFSSSCISVALCNVSELNAAEHFTQYQVKHSTLTETISKEIVCLKLRPQGHYTNQKYASGLVASAATTWWL